MENVKESIKSLNAKIKRREELITVLNGRIKVLQKRLDSDVIVDMRFIDEINDEKKEIKELEKDIKKLKRSIAILESNKY